MIQTERLIINNLKKEDAKAFSNYRNKPEVNKYQTWKHYSVFQAKYRINQCLREDFHKNSYNYQLAIRLLDETLIGDFYLEPKSNDSIVIGYTLDNTYWKQGYASEALASLLQWLHEVHHYQVIVAHVYMNNTASIELLKRTGFIQYKEDKKDNIVSYQYLF